MDPATIATLAGAGGSPFGAGGNPFATSGPAESGMIKVGGLTVPPMGVEHSVWLCVALAVGAFAIGRALK